MMVAPVEGGTWDDAVLAAALFAVDPGRLNGITVRARTGPVRDQWLAHVKALFPEETRIGKLPLNATDDSLFGGIDLMGTLASGRTAYRPGLLAGLDRGLLVIPLAERLLQGVCARLGAVLDAGEVAAADGPAIVSHVSRFGVVALDESEVEEEPPPASLLDRLALAIDLFAVGMREVTPSPFSRERIAGARTSLPVIAISEQGIAGLCLASVRLGIGSLRAPLFAVHAARASAALFGRPAVAVEDLAIAGRLVLGPRATIASEAQERAAPARETAEREDSGEKPGSKGPGETAGVEINDIILAAAHASLPPRLLSNQHRGTQRVAPKAQGGRAATKYLGATRGRPAGSGLPRGRQGERISLIDTMRTAVPWQILRRREWPESGSGSKIRVKRDDLRVRRHCALAQTTTIFSVDASGSTALQRLAEAKGAVELILGDCYIRRDRVALIAFRGHGAEVVLNPTRSLTRAKRVLAGLAGGGGTPLASGITAAAQLAMRIRRGGGYPAIVLLTDGRANVAADGQAGRDRAQTDAIGAARSLRRSGMCSLLIDTSPRGQPHAELLAREMGAQYLPLPHADALQISATVRAMASS